jgi:hypothetical protein
MGSVTQRFVVDELELAAGEEKDRSREWLRE